MATKTFKPTDISKYQQLLHQLKQLANQPSICKDKITCYSMIQSTKILSTPQKNNIKQEIKLSYINLNQQINSLEQYCRKESYSQWQSGIYNHGHESISEQLKEINSKLFEDNKSLIYECIRLRKIISQNANSQNSENKKINQVQITNLQFMNQINKLKLENIFLKLTRTEQNLQNKSYNNLKSQLNYHQNIQQLRIQINKLSAKLNQIKDKQKIKFQNVSSKLSSSNTTAGGCKTSQTDSDRERIISNIKIVYEDRIKNLQQEIILQKQQITRLNRVASFESQKLLMSQ